MNSMKVGETCEYMWRRPDLDERAIHTDLGVLPPLREEHRTRRYCAPALFTIVHMYIALHRIRAMRQSIHLRARLRTKTGRVCRHVLIDTVDGGNDGGGTSDFTGRC